jgi:hypothetical protein
VVLLIPKHNNGGEVLRQDYVNHLNTELAEWLIKTHRIKPLLLTNQMVGSMLVSDPLLLCHYHIMQPCITGISAWHCR